MAVAMRRRDQVAFQSTGKSVTVPNNDYAKLMYYLQSISSCIPGFDLPTEVTNFNRCYSLSNDDKVIILGLAALLSPDKLADKVIFPVEADAPILKGCSNKFYKITVASSLTGIATDLESAIIIQGQRVSITDIMVFSMGWLEQYYLNPLKNAVQSQQRALTYQQPSQPRASAYHATTTYQEPTSSSCCCCIIL